MIGESPTSVIRTFCVRVNALCCSYQKFFQKMKKKIESKLVLFISIERLRTSDISFFLLETFQENSQRIRKNAMKKKMNTLKAPPTITINFNWVVHVIK